MKKVKNLELWRAKATCDIGINALNGEYLGTYARNEKALYCLLQAVKDIATHLEKGEK